MGYDGKIYITDYNADTGKWSFDLVDENTYIVQFRTGLKDINRQEIYEGDIVKYHINDSYYENLLTSPVYWEDDRWRINYAANFYKWNFMEVLGNIFENPELLNIKN